MSTLQEQQNQKIIDYALSNFSAKTHEYGRKDQGGDLANKKTGELIDPSRENQDLDGDGRKGVDCSSLVSYSLQGAGIDVGQKLFATEYLFDKNGVVTNIAKKYFDVLPASSKTDGSLKPGDLLMLKMPNENKHIVIFKKYSDQNRIIFFGSQTSTGPKEVILTGNRYWEKESTYFGALRAKVKPEEEPTKKTSPLVETTGSSAPMGARKNSKYKVVSTSPSVNKTPRGSSVVDVPYDVQQDLSQASDTSPNVFFNGDPVYVKTSHSTKVTGDEKGSKGGVKSGTVGAQSDPIEASPSVFVNGKAVVRVGDVQYMQNKNTVGKVTTSESASAAHITDEGKIEGNTQAEPIAMPYAKNKPTNNSGTGSLGSRTGSPVLLKSGKLLYRVSDADFITPIRFDLQRVYVSDTRKGMFGNGWQCAYETRLIRSDPHTLSLTFSDDQVFRFSYSDKGFIDTDGLGAKLTLLSAQTFLLEYYNEPRSELYVNGHLLEIRDLNGNVLNFVREANGKLVRITSASALLIFEYNRNGHVSRITDHTNRVWNYTYDKHHNLIESIDPLSTVTHYRYDAQKPHLLESIIDPSDVAILEVNYDTTGRVLGYREGGVSYTYRYEKNRVVKTEKVNGEARDTTLGCEMGHQTFYGLDDWGVVRAITYPDGSTTREEYNDGTSITVDQGGNSSSKVFDERHRLIREVSADKRETLYIYDRNNPYYISMTRDDKITARTFDERYNLLSVTYHDTSKEMYSYDDRGNMISETDRSGISYSYAYNDLGQRIRVSDSLGGITQYVYDALGNTTTIIDPMERITYFECDKLSRLTTISDNAKNTIRLYYDKAGRQTALTDAQGNTTRYAYDENGFLAREILPNGESRTFTYERGLRTSMSLEDGKNIRMGYDKMRRLISKSIGDKTTRTTYDTLGNTLSVDDGTTVVEYVYDVNANIVLERLGDESVSYAYNADGTRRFIGYANAHYMLKRDESGNLSEIQKALESYKLSYTTDKRLSAITYPNQTAEKSTFDPLGRLIEKKLPDTELTYTYDKSSMITVRNDTAYAYDEICRLIRAGENTYLYDISGNRIDDEQSVIDPITNRLIQRGDETYQYDTMGRLIEKKTPSTITEYTYNIEGYLGAYIRTDKQTGQTLLSVFFIYDPLGRRISKHYKSTPVIPYPDTESTSNKYNNQIEYHHRYLYAGDNIVAIYDNDTDELLATLLHEEGIDTPLSISRYDKPTLSTWEMERLDADERYLYEQSLIHTCYYHRDHQNSIIALTNKEREIVESYSYDAFGSITHHTKTLETYNPYGYTGRETDTDDLYYYRARYYDPTIGRFITPDPIGFAGGDTNFYRYVGNDPVNFVDPSGLSGLLTSFLDQNNPIKDLVEWWDSTPDTSVSKTVTPNSTISQGKTNTQTNKPKTAQMTSKTAQTNKGDGTKIKGDVKPIVDEKCKDQKWFDPIKDPQLANYTQGGGKAPYWNVFGTVRNGKMHAGVDLLAKPGTNVYACVDCTVNVIDYLKPSHKGGANYGWYIYLKAKCPTFVRSQKKAYSLPYKKQGEMDKEAGFNDSNNAPIYFFYAHLLEIEEEMHKKYKSGIRIEVKAGQIIGKTGTSGYGTSADPHLHFEIRSNDNLSKKIHARVNPGFYVKYKLPEELTQSENTNQKEIAKKQQGDPSPKK